MASKKKNTDDFVLTNPFSEPIATIWEKWKSFKKEQFRFTYKPIGEQAAMDKLFKLSNGDINIASDIVNQSIENGWMGLFNLKNDVYGKTHISITSSGNKQSGTSGSRVQAAKNF